MTRTITLSEEVYKKLKRLKDSTGLGYSDLVNMLIETYHKCRVEELKKLCIELKVGDREVEEVVRITRDLRKRKWW